MLGDQTLRIFIFNIFIFEFCLHIYLCTPCVPDAHRDKRALDILGLQL